MKFLSVLELVFLALLLLVMPRGGFSAWTWNEGIRWFYLFLLSFLAVFLLYPVSVWLAEKTGAIDMPDERRVHTHPVPRLGGLAVYLAFIFSVLRNFQFSDEIIGLLAGSTVIYLLGALDDIKKLSANTRLVFQLLAAFIVVFSGLKITFTLQYGLFGKILSYAISVLWLVGITNAFNFMDGIDGLASTLGLVCSLLFLSVVVNTNQYHVAFISAALSGACLGFLKFNWRPAKTFLGDGGSTFIGFMLGCLAIYGSWASDNPVVALSTPVMILGIPIFDLIYTTVARVRSGKIRNVREWLEYAGKDHFHHRLLNLGFSVEMAVLFIAVLNVILGFSALSVILRNEIMETFVMIFQSVLIFILVVILMLNARNKERETPKA